MTVTRVADYSQFLLSQLNLSTNQQNFNTLSQQVTSGYVSKDYQGVASQSARLISLDKTQSASNQYLDNINQLTTRLGIYNTTLTSISSILDNFSNAIAQTANSNSPPNLALQAKTDQLQLSNYLNTQDGTRYLFAGSNVNTTPVDDPSVATTNEFSVTYDPAGATNFFKKGDTVTDAALGGQAIVLSDGRIDPETGRRTVTLQPVTVGDYGKFGAGDTLKVGATVIGTTITSAIAINGQIPISTETPISAYGAPPSIARNVIEVAQQTDAFGAPGGAFSAGDIVTGSTSGATAEVVAETNGGTQGRLYLRAISGVFVEGETLTATNPKNGSAVDAIAVARGGVTPPPVDTFTVDYNTGLGPAFAPGQIVNNGAAGGKALVTGVTSTGIGKGRLTLQPIDYNSAPPHNNTDYATFTTPQNLFIQGQATSSGSTTLIGLYSDSTTDYYTNTLKTTELSQHTRIADDLYVNYGISANDPAFEAFNRVLNYFQKIQPPYNPDDLTESVSILADARTKLQGLEANVGINQVVATNETATLKQTISLAQSASDTIDKVDQATTIEQFQSLQTQINASYQAFNITHATTLLNYLPKG